MTDALAAELRLAAKQARALAGALPDLGAKQGFLDLAAKYEAEALAIEARDGFSRA